MMIPQLVRPDTQGGYRVLGIPVSFGKASSERIHNMFETENPQLFVPKVFGIGWDINIGALAVKAGLLRPDDSLPDMRRYVDETTEAFLVHAPRFGLALTLAAAIPVLKLPEAVYSWDLVGRPRKQSSGLVAALLPCTVSAVAAVYSEFVRNAARKQPSTGSELLAASSALGLQTMSLIALGATYRSAAKPSTTSVLPQFAVAAVPIVTAGVFVSVVRKTLSNINRELEGGDEH